MPVTARNLVMGPAEVWIGDFGVTEPLDSAIGSDPGAGWVNIGGTLGGIVINVDQTYTELLADQIVDPIGSRRTARVMRLVTQLAEATLDNFARMLNQALPTPGSGIIPFDPVNDNSATQPLYKAVLVDGWAPGDSVTEVSLRRRIIARKCLNISSIGAPYSKDGQTVYNAEWKAHYVSSSIRPFHIVDDTAA